MKGNADQNQLAQHKRAANPTDKAYSHESYRKGYNRLLLLRDADQCNRTSPMEIKIFMSGSLGGYKRKTAGQKHPDSAADW